MKTVLRLIAWYFAVVPLVTSAAGRCDLRTLRAALSGHPESAARDAAGRGDLRYLGVLGYTGIVPGVLNQSCASLDRNIRWLEGTSDALCSAEHRSLNDRAMQFAKRYNLELITLRKSRNLETCNEG